VAIAVGETFERYAVESLIGRGGMGEVYRAVDTRLRRKVALKVLRPGRDGDPDAVARLFREARAAAGLTHPNTVAIHDIGEANGTFYIVMELVTGTPLLAYVGDERTPLPRKVRWLVDIARALAAAHRAGVIHRDVKPSNVMISDEGAVKVLDFGLAKPLDPVSFRTMQGRVVGTPRYMAPEQVTGGDVDARTDQYAFGLVAYELLAGRHPGGVLGTTLTPQALDAVAPGVPRAVAEVVRRTLAGDPERRYASMEDVAVALEDAMAGRVSRFAERATDARGASTSSPEAARASLPDTVPAGPSPPPSSPPPGTSSRAASADVLDDAMTAKRAAAAHADAPLGATLLSREAPSFLGRLPAPAPPAPSPVERVEQKEEHVERGHEEPRAAPVVAPPRPGAGPSRARILLVVGAVALAAVAAAVAASTQTGAPPAAPPSATPAAR